MVLLLCGNIVIILLTVPLVLSSNQFSAFISVTEGIVFFRLYLASTSRQNLETIVEAIRHLEGDHLFSDDPSPRCGQQQHLSSSVMDEPTQEVPLALTTHNKPITQPTQTQVAHRLLKVEMNPFLQFHSSPHSTQQRTALQQQRPGVIVVKQHT